MVFWILIAVSFLIWLVIEDAEVIVEVAVVLVKESQVLMVVLVVVDVLVCVLLLVIVKLVGFFVLFGLGGCI